MALPIHTAKPGRFLAPLAAACGAAALILAASFAAPRDASAQSVENFYAGKQMTMLIASGVGGGYDAYARALARHMVRHIPGNPIIVPRNIPGASGLIAISTLYNTSKPDGLTFAALTNGVAMDPLFGTSANRFDALELNWIGSIGKLENICLTWETSPITTIEQAREHEVIVGAAGATSNTSVMPRILNAFLGTQFRVIGGYAEGSGTTLALESGEIDGICGISYSTLKVSHPAWIIESRLNVLVQLGLDDIAALPDVPNAIDLITDPEAKAALELILVRQEMGRPFAAPPGVPPELIAVLRQAFEATIRDPAFLVEASRLNLEIDPLTGQEIETLLKTAYSAPAHIVARAAALVRP
ncbi:MAG: hypothetical protein IID54_00465 [Proteobacteria bacterium]|nr:hypothetical protein [Pseudomonadota bacterium]